MAAIALVFILAAALVHPARAADVIGRKHDIIGGRRVLVLSRPPVVRGADMADEGPIPQTPGKGGGLGAKHVRRHMQNSGNGCGGILCPDVSTCQVLSGGAPACICPISTPHLVDNRCTASLEHADFLDPHNAARAALGMEPLVWNDTLAASALAWAQVLSPNCSNLTHGGLYGSNGERLGQNLAAEFGYKNIDNTWPVNAWLGERQYYTYAPVGSSTACVPGQMCGHYTQVLWNNSRSVGCALTTCTWPGFGIGLLWACDYYPPGNVYGEYPFARSAASTGFR